eukprot:s1804_g18.t2
MPQRLVSSDSHRRLQIFSEGKDHPCISWVMIDSLFIVSTSGSYIVERHFCGHTPRLVCEPLVEKLCAGEKADALLPVFSANRKHVLIHVVRDLPVFVSAAYSLIFAHWNQLQAMQLHSPGGATFEEAMGEPRGRRNVGETVEVEAKSDAQEEVREHGSATGVALQRANRDLARFVDNTMRLGQSIFHVAMRIIGPCMVVLAYSLQGFVAYAYFWHAVPPLCEAIGVPTCSAISSVGVFLLMNALYNYTKAIITPAGLPPPFEKAQLELMELSEKQITPRQCSKCNLLKPPRYFFLFLFFLAQACLFIDVVFGIFFYDIIFAFGRRGTRSFRNYIMMSFMICASIFAALCLLGGFHFYLILTNQTTIEFQINMVRRRQCRRHGEFFRNPYDMGRNRNCQEVFGPNSLWGLKWMFPYLAAPPTGDGLKYASIWASEI